MAVTINTNSGKIDFSNEVIAGVVGNATTEVFGVVGMTSQNTVRDNMRTILRQENYSRGVTVTSDEAGTIIDIYVVVSYGIKISEVARNVQERVRFNLENQLGITNAVVNVYVQNVKVEKQ